MQMGEWVLYVSETNVGLNKNVNCKNKNFLHFS